MTADIVSRLREMSDPAYRDFTASLIPTVDAERVIGVRIPELRRMAKEMTREKSADAFLSDLPHRYLEEDMLHSILLSAERDYGRLISGLEAFLPCVDNWAVCDALRPAAFKKHPEDLPGRVWDWLDSGRPYTVRFGIAVLMTYYLDGAFERSQMERVAAVRSGEYYVNMMIAWYFATALAKQYDTAVTFLEEQRLDRWCHNRTIRKATESFRVTDEHKAYLRSLKVQQNE